MTENGAGGSIKFKVLYIVIPLAASALGGGIGAYTTISVQSSQIETMKRNIDTIASSMSALTLTSTKLAGVVEERGPRIAQLEQQVNNLAQRVDHIKDNERR